MATAGRIILGTLAWLWVASLLGTLLDLLALSGEIPLEFRFNFFGVALHWLVWLLVWPAARYWGWQLPRLLWGGVMGLVFIGFFSLILGPLGVIGLIPVIYTADFFLGISRWRTKYVYFQRGPDVMVLQLRPVGPLLQLVDPLSDNQPAQATAETPGYAGWTAVMKPDAAFSFDANEQKRLNANLLAERRCLADKRRLDSLALAGQLPRLVLPAATQRGANVFGCLVDGEVWRDYGTCFDGQTCVECGARGWLQRAKGAKPSYGLTVRANGPLRKGLALYLPQLTGPGVFQCGRGIVVPANSLGFRLELQEGERRDDAAKRVYCYNTPDQLMTVVITRLDTVAHIVAGTFEGAVKRQDADSTTRVIIQGRFDVHYNTGDWRAPQPERPAAEQ